MRTRGRKLVASERGHDDRHWLRYAEFGWLAVPFSEEDGGIGGDATDTGIVMEGVGRGLLPWSRTWPTWCWPAACWQGSAVPSRRPAGSRR